MKNYQLWLQRVARIIRAYQAGKITAQQLFHFQCYILEFGQYNANFTLEELTYLDYPKSPFAPMHRHTYIRGTETWATEICRQFYEEDPTTVKGVYPVFIDSPLFWEQASQCCTIIDVEEISKDTNNFLQRLEANAYTECWIALQNPEEKIPAEEQIQRILRGRILETAVPEDLRDAMLREEYKYSDPEKDKLDLFLSSELAIVNQKLEMRPKKIDKSSEEMEKQKFGKLYRQFKAEHSTLLQENQITNFAQFREFSVKHSEAFAAACQLLQNKQDAIIIRKDHRHYEKAIKLWWKRKLTPLTAKLYYVMKGTRSYLGMDTFLCFIPEAARNNDSWGPKALVNRLGYRIEPRRALRAVLERYPLLFVDEQQTRQLWPLLLKTPMIQALNANVDEITKIQNCVDMIYTTTAPAPKTNFKWVCEDLENRRMDSVFGFYQRFALDYLDSFKKFHPEGTVVYEILMPELADALERFISACKEKPRSNLSKAILAMQTIGQALSLDAAFSPFEPSFSILGTIKNRFLKAYPVQCVAMAPFGMRAYLRVLQASNLGRQHNPNIVVTNQNYFEWLLTLKNLNAYHASLTLARQLEDIDRSADMIFAEIHPNNATEKKQFAQNLREFVVRMKKERWVEKQRTLIFDATLNALDEREVLDILDEALPLIQRGVLNIVILQSLTKFSQIGFDLRSGGITVVINHREAWLDFNNTFDTIVAKEPIDQSALQYFSHFLSPNANFLNRECLIISYISLINQRVNLVYQEILDQLRPLGLAHQKYFQLTTSADPRGCYISLNSASLLSHIDPTFLRQTSEIEAFNESILQDFFIPLCRIYQLPVTQRMSIAFPLSSVNVVFDSIRFTVGLESYEELYTYAFIIAYISFSINYFPHLRLLFEKNNEGAYPHRQQFFHEKIRIFKAMSVDLQHEPEENYVLASTAANLPLRVTFDSETIEVECTAADGATRVLQPYFGFSEGVKAAGNPLNNLKLKQIRLLASLFTGFGNTNQTEVEHRIILQKNLYAILFKRKHLTQKAVFGPFSRIIDGRAETKNPKKQKSAYFILGQNEFHCLLDNRCYPLEHITLLHGNIITPCPNLSYTQLEHFLLAAAYTETGTQQEFLQEYPLDEISTQYTPPHGDQLTITILDNGIGIERDYVCYNNHGLTFFKRFFSNTSTIIEMDYWQEKDPAICRLMTFTIALFIKRKYGADFKVGGSPEEQSSMYKQFLFRFNFNDADRCLADAWDVVHAHKNLVVSIWKEYQASGAELQQPFLFFSNPPPGHPYNTSFFDGPTQIQCSSFIEKILTALNCHPEPAPRPESLLRRGFFLSAEAQDEVGSSSTLGKKH